ncbi:MAG: hypothetical protein HYX94_09170 [Chloroflexi bacterium]|nr:hypothetical protein [Chloroflexota bacterium]
MINVTEEAKVILRGVLDDALGQHVRLPQGTPEPALRLLIEEDGASFALDYPESGDEVILHGGRWLLIVSPAIVEILGDSTVDIVDSADGAQLSIQREVPTNGHAKEAA